MKKIKLPLLLSALFFANLSFTYAAPAVLEPKVQPAFDLLADLSTLLDRTAPPAAAVQAAPPELVFRYVAPPCKPSQALLPGTALAPKVSDERRVKAINELLGKVAICTPLPYNNDGVIHTDPHAGLPVKPAGFYKEYTLIVPGRETGDGPEPVVVGGHTYMAGPVLSHRGAERLMIGGGSEIYYTPDHYKTFIHLDIVR